MAWRGITDGRCALAEPGRFTHTLKMAKSQTSPELGLTEVTRSRLVHRVLE